MKRKAENQIILESLKAVLKTIHRNPTNNEFYINTEDFNYNLLSDHAIKTLKRLVENY